MLPVRLILINDNIKQLIEAIIKINVRLTMFLFVFILNKVQYN